MRMSSRDWEGLGGGEDCFAYSCFGLAGVYIFLISSSFSFNVGLISANISYV